MERREDLGGSTTTVQRREGWSLVHLLIRSRSSLWRRREPTIGSESKGAETLWSTEGRANTINEILCDKRGERSSEPSTMARMAAVKQQEQESHEEGNILLHACPKRVVLEEEDEARFVS